MVWDPSLIHKAAQNFRELHKGELNQAVVLGSGTTEVLTGLDVLAEIPFSILPVPSYASVSGHSMVFQVVRYAGRPVLVQRGRMHLYQGYSAFETALPVALMAELGIKSLVLTNAAGGIRPGLKTGDILAITDHINLQSAHCLNGAPQAFLDMSQAYSVPWYHCLDSQAVLRGVYCGLTGPSYETPAEIRYLAAIGADVVGMSTIQEVLMARYRGIRIGLLSLVTNLAAGLGQQALSHQEVLESGKAASARLQDLILTLLDSDR